MYTNMWVHVCIYAWEFSGNVGNSNYVSYATYIILKQIMYFIIKIVSLVVFITIFQADKIGSLEKRK